MESRQVVGFAFEPEYSEEEIARMEADRCTEEAESSDETDDGADHAAGRLANVDWKGGRGSQNILLLIMSHKIMDNPLWVHMVTTSIALP